MGWSAADLAQTRAGAKYFGVRIAELHSLTVAKLRQTPPHPGMGTGTLVLPWPPSVNAHLHSAGKGLRLRNTPRWRAYLDQVVAAVLAQWTGAPFWSLPVVLSLDYHPPDAGPRDLDNHLKALIDGLTKAQVWCDDQQVREIHARWGAVANPAHVVVTITQRGDW